MIKLKFRHLELYYFDKELANYGEKIWTPVFLTTNSLPVTLYPNDRNTVSRWAGGTVLQIRRDCFRKGIVGLWTQPPLNSQCYPAWLCVWAPLSASSWPALVGVGLGSNQHAVGPFPIAPLALWSKADKVFFVISKILHSPLSCKNYTSPFHTIGSKGGYRHTNLVQIPIPKYPGYIILGKLFNASKFSVFSSLKWGIITVPILKD